MHDSDVADNGVVDIPSTETKTGTKQLGIDVAGMHTLSTLATESGELLNRELSWLAFNERVLAEAKDERNPLLERLKYAGICGSNLDEFFMVRVAGIHRQIAAGVTTPSPDGLLPGEVLSLVRVKATRMLKEIESALHTVLALLAEQGVFFSRVTDLDKSERAQLREQYLTQIHPVLTPLIVDPAHPFPYLSNLSLNLGVVIDDNKGGEDFARVKIPVGLLPRVVRIGDKLLMLEEVIAEHMGELFKGRTILATHVFRVTRNADYDLAEEEAEDLLVTIKEALNDRRFGAAVRLEVTEAMPEPVVAFLKKKLLLHDDDIFRLKGPLGTADLMSLPVQRPELAFANFVPALADFDGAGGDGIFEKLRSGDVLLHHPYDSFAYVLNFLEEAARDPNVLAIKQTLYRTGDDPRLFGALRSAAENGKQVVAMIELKARFDEKRNISWAEQLERVGAHVVYGIPGLKTHAKCTLVVRREEDGRLQRYVHIGSGNYNAKTARLYTDLSLLSADAVLGADVGDLFNHLTGYADADYQHLLVAPHTARLGFETLLEREMAHAAAGREAWVRLKFNSLTDPDLIAALYRASAAGVKIDMVIRGVCCLRPGVTGLSENIRVRSLLGRYLEHARIYAFANGGTPEVYFGSADWMSRNLNRRVEVIAPLLDDRLRTYALGILDTEWQDERGSWILNSAGEYHKCKGDRSAQEQFSRDRQ